MKIHETTGEQMDLPLEEPGYYVVRIADDMVASGPFKSRREAAQEQGRCDWWRKNPRGYDVAYGTQDDNGMFIDQESKLFKEDEVTEVTEPLAVGAKIRTKRMGMEGVVEKIEGNEVFFKAGDGRMMKTSENNVIPVEKLEDGLPGSFSNSDYTPGSRGVGLRPMPSPNLCKTCHGKGWVPQGEDWINRNIKIECPGCRGSGSIKEGGMGGINRSHPAVDVTYQHVLDEIMDKYMQQHDVHQGPERREEPKPEPVPGLNREKAQKIANALGIRLNDTVYVYKLVKDMISLDEMPPTVRMAIYNLIDPQHGMPTTPEGALKPFVMNKLRQIVSEHQLREEITKLQKLYRN
jgi:hypothetical protein